MLLPQVPGATRMKVAKKLGFDLKLLSGSIKTEEDTVDSLHAQLRVVEDFIKEHEDVGFPWGEHKWIQGTLTARFVEVGEDCVFFISAIEGHLLGLGGSAHHLIGAAKPEGVGVPFSFAFHLTKELSDMAERNPEYILRLNEESMNTYLSGSVGQGFRAWESIMQWAYNHAIEREMRIEFLAKRLVTERMGKVITLASPLFVAMADE